MPISRDGAALRLKPGDNVAVCLLGVEAGSELDFGDVQVTAAVAIPAGHKIALRAITASELIVKYGQTIGKAVVTIGPGEHVHVHNVEGTRGRGDLPAPSPEATPAGRHGAAL